MKRKITNSYTFISSYKFRLFNAGGWLSGTYRHSKHGFISIRSEESFTNIQVCVDDRIFSVTCRPGTTNKKTLRVVVSRLLIPQIEKDIQAHKENTK